jgi:CRISPR system Cascade subunit CasA
LVEDIVDNPVVALACPRPDFDGAVTEFLIGLLATAFRLRDDDDWCDVWRNPPSPQDLRAALLALPDAFDLDGEGPRFLQDFSPGDLADAELAPVQELLVEGKNDPLFIKPDTIRSLGRPAAAMALITIQSYSPAGGRGHRTSMRGGGPLTTLVDPRPSSSKSPIDVSLWRYLWANVPTLDALPGGTDEMSRRPDPPAIFPWLGPTRTSEGDRATTLADANPLQCFFGMPRRIRLEFADHSGRCGLTGAEEARLVTGFRVKAYGIQYKGWRHPFSPHYQGKQANEWLPVHGQPGGIGWRDWYPLLHSSASGTKLAATVVERFNQSRAERVDSTRFSLRAFGFDVTNAKARAWIDARLPAFAEHDEARLRAIASLVASLTDATDLAAYSLQRAVVDALYRSEEDPPGDLSFVKASLWAATEKAFYDSVFKTLDSDMYSVLPDIRRAFLAELRAAAEGVFDNHVDPDTSSPEQLRRSVVARFGLVMTLSGAGKSGDKLFQALGLATLKAKKERTAKTSSARKAKA